MPGMLEIKITGLRDLQGRFARVIDELAAARRDELRELGRQAVAALQQEAPVRTGRLRRGLRFHTTESGALFTLSATSEAPYTDLVLHGRGPVYAKHARYLRFEPGPPGSGFIFRKRVGPAKANPFTQRAFGKMDGLVEQTIRRMAARIQSAWERG